MRKRAAAIASALWLIPLETIPLNWNAIEYKNDIYQISSLARQSAVELIFPSGWGSGVIISKTDNQYAVLTALHLFEDINSEKQFRMRTSDHTSYKLKQKNIQQINNTDMAIFFFESNRSYPTASLSNLKSYKGKTVLFSSGFSSGSFHFKQGNLIAKAKVSIKDGNQLIYSSKVIPGMSGGGVFDINGQLVGINTMSNLKTFDDKHQPNSTGIPISYYQNYINNKSYSISNILITFDDHLAKANEISIEEGDQELLIKIIEQGLKLINDDINNLSTWFAYKHLCSAKVKIGDNNGAKKDCNNAIYLNKKDIYSYLNLGIVKSNLDDDYGAISEYNKIIELDSQNSFIYLNRGYSKSKIGDHKGAISDYTIGINIKPEYESFIGRALALDKLGDTYGAISDLNKAIKINPDDFLAYTNRGIGKKKLGDIKGACSDWRKAQKLGGELSNKFIRNHCK
tara:strand:+ start:16110 stop:17477 length:1368 start_codon:yes stop_codon:yes gene_type:complete